MDWRGVLSRRFPERRRGSRTQRVSLQDVSFPVHDGFQERGAVRSRAPLPQRIAELRGALPEYHQADLRDLVRFFTLGGLRSRLLG